MPRGRSAKAPNGASGKSAPDQSLEPRATYSLDQDIHHFEDNAAAFHPLSGAEMDFDLVGGML
jgi:hypothetical protein